MHIQSFEIEQFGVFHHAKVEGLGPGVVLFFGSNEAGKSTCLEFLRIILTGFPAYGSTQRRLLAPFQNDQLFGKAWLEDEKYGKIQISRIPSKRDTLLVADQYGKSLETNILEQIFHGISREMYCSVFGFSLSEIQSLSNLGGDEISSALYGASFGTGLHSPLDAIKQLEQRRDSIFINNGHALLNEALKEWEHLQIEISAATQESAQYDGLATLLSEKRSALIALRQQKLAVEEECRLLERRLGVWRQWDEWRTIAMQLERLPKLSGKFPEDALQRMVRLEENIEAYRRLQAAQEAKLHGLKAQQKNIKPDRKLLEALPTLRRLAERKNSYRQALTALPSQENLLNQAEARLEQELARLGQDWTCERIQHTNRSLEAREELENLAKNLDQRKIACDNAIQIFEKSQRDLEQCELDIQKAEEILNALPNPKLTLQYEERELVRQNLHLLEDCQQRLPLRQKALQNAIKAFNAVFDPLELLSSKPDIDLQNILDKREEAVALATEIADTSKKLLQTGQELQFAKARFREDRQRLDNVLRDEQLAEGGNRENLNNRATAIRQLRLLATEINTERAKLLDLDNRIATFRPVPASKSIPLIIAGTILALLGLGIILSPLFVETNELAVNESPNFPFNSWIGYLILAGGGLVIAGGLPRGKAEVNKQRGEIGQLRLARADTAEKIQKLNEQAQALYSQAQVENIDSVTLETAEDELEKERERCFEEEQLQRDLSLAKHNLSQSQSQFEVIQAKYTDYEMRAKEQKDRWQIFMNTLGIENLPNIENIATFFDRAQAAKDACLAVNEIQNEVAELEAKANYVDSLLRNLLPIAEQLSIIDHNEPESPEALKIAANNVLNACQNIDLAREEYIRASALLQNRQENYEYAKKEKQKAEADYHLSLRNYEDAKLQWSNYLQNLGLSPELDAGTVREAFNSMDNCLTAETAVMQAKEELSQSRRELTSLRDPLYVLLMEVGRDSEIQSSNPDWLALLDQCLEDGSLMEDRQREYDVLNNRILEEENILRANLAELDMALDSWHRLLKAADANDSDQFRHKAAQHTERLALERRHSDLEESLRLAAGTLDFQEFLSGFNVEDHENQEHRHTDLANLLLQMQELETSLADEAASISARVTALANVDVLQDLYQREALLKESMSLLALRWSRNTLASMLLRQAKNVFERERQPQVIRLASEIFSAITGGAWKGITADIEGKQISILPQKGAAVAPYTLSRGTQEQAYMALRLAYIQNHAANTTPLPIIMDDVLVNSDAERTQRMAKVLVNLAQGRYGPAQQLIYFTCHKHLVQMLFKINPQTVLFTVDNATIRRSEP